MAAHTKPKKVWITHFDTLAIEKLKKQISSTLLIVTF